MLTVTATVTDAGGHSASASTSVVVAGANTDYLMGAVMSVRTTNVTYSTPGQVISNVLFDGARVSVTAPDVELNECVFTGDNSVNALLTTTNIAAKRVKVNHGWFHPKFLNEKNAISGHDVELYDVLIEGTTDGISISNGAQFAATGAGWATGMIGRRVMIRRLGRLTSVSKTLAGNNDTVTHNDGIQQFGGVGTDFEDFVIDARPGRQVAHFFLQSASGHVYTVEEAWALPDAGPFICVPMGSLPDGGPYASPFLDSTHPARPLPWVSNGTGLASTGELSRTDWSALMCNSSQGYSAGFRFVNGIIYGGEVPIQSAANPYPGSGISWGTMSNVKFDRSQGLQGHTVDLNGNWAGHATIPTTGTDANTHLDGGLITVRF